VGGNNVRFLNCEAVEDLIADRLRESLEVGVALLALAETLVLDQVGGTGEEFSVVLAEVVARHVREVARTLNEDFKIVVGIPPVCAKVRVAFAHVVRELVEGWLGVLSNHTGDVSPSFAVKSCVAEGPLDGTCVVDSGATRELLNIFEKLVKS